MLLLVEYQFDRVLVAQLYPRLILLALSLFVILTLSLGLSDVYLPLILLALSLFGDPNIESRSSRCLPTTYSPSTITFWDSNNEHRFFRRLRNIRPDSKFTPL